MNAPDKITISKYNITNDGDVVFAWLTNSPDCEPMNHPVEYVRADAFIEKASKWINEHTSLSEKLVIENFRKYMEGE